MLYHRDKENARVKQMCFDPWRLAVIEYVGVQKKYQNQK